MAERIESATAQHGWFSAPSGIALLWTAWLAGPLAWAADLTASYALVKWTCGSQQRFVIHLVTLFALAIIGVGVFAGLRALGAAPYDADDEGRRPFDRGHFMAVVGLLACAMFALAVIAAEIPRAVLDACI